MHGRLSRLRLTLRRTPPRPRYLAPAAAVVLAVPLAVAATAGAAQATTAFRDPDGSVAVVVLNTATTAEHATFAAGGAGPVAIPYLTDDTHDTAAQAPVPVSHGSFGATLPARSLVTYFLPAH